MVKKPGYWVKREFYQAIRMAISGSEIGPPLVESMVILGKKETLKRLRDYNKWLKKQKRIEG